MKFNYKLFQSRTVDDNDVLSYHFKEQCKIQRKFNATMPHLRSIDHQPSVRIKANGAIVLNRSSIPLDWVSRDSLEENQDLSCKISNPENHSPGSNSTLSSDSFLSATPVRHRASYTMNQDTYPHTIIRSSSLPSVPSACTERYQISYEQKLGILLEEMDDVQQESLRIKKNYNLLEQKHHRLERTLAQRDHLIQALQSQLESFMHP